jgi:hypothetical protein
MKTATMIRPSDEALALIDQIQHKREKLMRAGLEPKRVYMSLRTKLTLVGGIFHPSLIVTVPHGYERRDTIYGLDIHEVDSLPDGFIDIGADDQY